MSSRIRKVNTFLSIIILAFFNAACYEIFIFPNSFAPSGINGIATMLQYLFHFSVGYISIIINIPLMALAFFHLSKDYALKSMAFVAAFSAGLLFFQYVVDLSHFAYISDYGKSQILAPIASGVLNGAIYGMVFRLGGSAGGTDIIGSLIHKKRGDIDLAWIIFSLNSAVSAISYFVYGFNFEPVILCIIYSFISSKVTDSMLKGTKSALKFEVITPYAEELSKDLIDKMHHSVTVLPAIGMYTHQQKNMLVCVINKHQIVNFISIVNKYPDTFAYVSNVTGTVGNFKKIPTYTPKIKKM